MRWKMFPRFRLFLLGQFSGRPADLFSEFNLQICFLRLRLLKVPNSKVSVKVPICVEKVANQVQKCGRYKT